MNCSRRALYLYGASETSVELEGQVWRLGEIDWYWSCRNPDTDTSHEPASHALIVVDGGSLRDVLVPVVQRLRWSGFDGIVLVVRFGRSELERVLAHEAGASEVHAGRLTRAMIADIAPDPSGLEAGGDCAWARGPGAGHGTAYRLLPLAGQGM